MALKHALGPVGQGRCGQPADRLPGLWVRVQVGQPLRGNSALTVLLGLSHWWQSSFGAYQLPNEIRKLSVEIF